MWSIHNVQLGQNHHFLRGRLSPFRGYIISFWAQYRLRTPCFHLLLQLSCHLFLLSPGQYSIWLALQQLYVWLKPNLFLTTFLHLPDQPLPLVGWSSGWSELMSRTWWQKSFGDTGRGPPPKSLDSNDNFKPEHTLFCRKLRFVAIYALLFGDIWA